MRELSHRILCCFRSRCPHGEFGSIGVAKSDGLVDDVEAHHGPYFLVGVLLIGTVICCISVVSYCTISPPLTHYSLTGAIETGVGILLLWRYQASSKTFASNVSLCFLSLRSLAPASSTLKQGLSESRVRVLYGTWDNHHLPGTASIALEAPRVGGPNGPQPTELWLEQAERGLVIALPRVWRKRACAASYSPSTPGGTLPISQ